MGSNSLSSAIDPKLTSLSSTEKANRKPWSAPNETLGNPLGVGRNQRGPGPGEGPNYGRAKLAQQQQINTFADPLQHLHRGRSNGQYQQSEYSPSVYDVNGSRVNARKTGNFIRSLTMLYLQRVIYINRI